MPNNPIIQYNKCYEPNIKICTTQCACYYWYSGIDQTTQESRFTGDET